MYQEFLELVTIDCASGKETPIAEKLKAKLTELGFTVTQDQAGETFGGECGNVYAVREGELGGSLMFSSQRARHPSRRKGWCALF